MITATSFAFAVLYATADPSPAMIRGAVERALPSLKAAAEGHIEKKACFGCHNQAYPMAAFEAASKLGFPMDDDLRRSQVAHVRQFVAVNRKNFDTHAGTGGQIDTAGWLLLTFELAGEKPDDDTAAIVGYILNRHADRKHWAVSSNRPPTQASSFTSSYLAVHSLKTWGTNDQKEAIAKRIDTVRAWAVKTPAKDTEDRVYRLRLLHAAGAGEKVVADAGKELLATQRPDGGWSQTADMTSDAYATATAMAALAAVNALSVKEAPYRRGVSYLLRAQQGDGTWFVKTHSPRIQPHYESGFPYANDQFISVTATSWAAVALAAAGAK